MMNMYRVSCRCGADYTSASWLGPTFCLACGSTDIAWWDVTKGGQPPDDVEDWRFNEETEEEVLKRENLDRFRGPGEEPWLVEPIEEEKEEW